MAKLSAFIIKRLLSLIPIVLGITFLTFALMRLAGGDAVTYLYENAGQAVSDEIIEAARHRYGLDQPFIVQYGRWLAGMLTGDMGESYVSGRDVFSTFMEKLPATALLTASSVLLTVLVAVPLGVTAAFFHNKAADWIIRFLSFIGNATPSFVAALVLIYVLSVRLHLLPVITSEDTVKSLVMPTVTLALAMAAKYTRQVRAAVLSELGKPYVTGAKSRGVKDGVIIWASVMRTALVSIVTLLALSIGSLLGGTAIVETIFQWDGVGKLAVDAINMRDYPIIQAYVVWMALIYVVIDLLADILYHILDPRVRLGGEGL